MLVCKFEIQSNHQMDKQTRTSECLYLFVFVHSSIIFSFLQKEQTWTWTFRAAVRREEIIFFTKSIVLEICGQYTPFIIAHSDGRLFVSFDLQGMVGQKLSCCRQLWAAVTARTDIYRVDSNPSHTAAGWTLRGIGGNQFGCWSVSLCAAPLLRSCVPLCGHNPRMPLLSTNCTQCFARACRSSVSIFNWCCSGSSATSGATSSTLW